MQFYIESYLHGNPMEQNSKDKADDVMNYLSSRFILIGNKLGVGTEYVKDILNENYAIIKDFRLHYKPFDYKYKITFTLGNNL